MSVIIASMLSQSASAKEATATAVRTAIQTGSEPFTDKNELELSVKQYCCALNDEWRFTDGYCKYGPIESWDVSQIINTQVLCLIYDMDIVIAI